MSPDPLKNILVIGGSGNAGSAILAALLADQSFDVSVLSRLDSSASFPERVRVIKTDYSEENLVGALQGQDAIVSAVGGTAFLQQKPVIEAAVKAGVKRFIPSEYGSNTLSDVVRELVPLFEQKKEVLDQLKDKESLGLTWTGLATGGFFDWGIENGFLGFDLKEQSATVWDDGNKRFSLTNMATVASAIVAILKRPAETANKFLYVASATTTQSRILEALEKATGKQWTKNSTSTKEQREMAGELLSQGNMAGIFINVKAAAWSAVPGIRSDFERDEALANKLLGLDDQEDVQATIDRVVRTASKV